MTRTFCLAAACALTLVAFPVVSAEAETKIPDAVQTALDKAETFELLSLDPSQQVAKGKDAFHNYTVLGKTTVKDGEVRKRIVAALAKGAKENEDPAARCFDPRHGIRVKQGDKTFDLVICFECNQVQVYVDGKHEYGFYPSRAPETVLDKVLKEAGVKLAAKKGK